MSVILEVKYPGESKITEAHDGKTIEEILLENNISPDSVVVLKNNRPIPITERVEDGDKIVVIIAFSGG